MVDSRFRGNDGGGHGYFVIILMSEHGLLLDEAAVDFFFRQHG